MQGKLSGENGTGHAMIATYSDEGFFLTSFDLPTQTPLVSVPYTPVRGSSIKLYIDYEVQQKAVLEVQIVGHPPVVLEQQFS